MATRERFSRKQLKQPDEFVSTLERAIDFCQKNQGVLISVALVVVVVIGGASFAFYSSKQGELRMENLLDEMKNIGQNAAGKSPVADQLKKYLDQFDEGIHKQRARLLLAGAFYQDRKFSEAIAVYNEILSHSQPGETIYELAQAGLGYSYESEKDYKKAIEIYKSIVDRGKTLSLFDIYLSLARTYELAQDPKNALLILREMENKFKDHAQLFKVHGKIKKLEG
ncbi:MAG: tol-pal system YbgF family protein [Nitrospinales bacterium]